MTTKTHRSSSPAKAGAEASPTEVAARGDAAAPLSSGSVVLPEGGSDEEDATREWLRHLQAGRLTSSE